jgi:curved DNA-binding protein CbpA
LNDLSELLIRSGSYIKTFIPQNAYREKFPAMLSFGIKNGFSHHTRQFTSASTEYLGSYATLGLSAGSSEDQIKSAYRKLVKLHHPDLGGETERFVRIQRAYEFLMDPSKRGNSERSSSGGPVNSASNSQYWRSWGTDQSWWNGKSNTGYSPENDFDSEFEAQWEKFSRDRMRQSNRKFKAKKGYNAYEPGAESADSESTSGSRSNDSSQGRHSRKQKKRTVDPVELPTCISIKSDRESISGRFERVSKFNGRICFHNSTSNLFMFWSNQNKDWKISDALRDDGNCVAFNDRIHPSLDLPFVVGDSTRWMVWNERGRRYIPTKVIVDVVEEDYSQWSIDKLRQRLRELGLEQKMEDCFEKGELVELMRLYGKTEGKPDSKQIRADSPIPEGSYRLCSRQRHDGVVQAPPVLSDKCTVSKNRVEKFIGKLEQVEEWLVKHGDRRRYYGVFDSDRNFCFGLVWKNHKNWARTGPHEW